MTIKARGDNATVYFDGAEVFIERHSMWRSRINDTVAEAAYPVGQIIGVQLYRPTRDQVGTFALIFDACDHPDHAPITVEYQRYRRDVFDDLAAVVAEAVRRVVRATYPGVPMPWMAGAVVQQAPGIGALAQPYAAPVAGLAGQFQALAAQRDAGILTGAEFTAAKAKLLGSPADAVP